MGTVTDSPHSAGPGIIDESMLPIRLYQLRVTEQYRTTCSRGFSGKELSADCGLSFRTISLRDSRAHWSRPYTDATARSASVRRNHHDFVSLFRYFGYPVFGLSYRQSRQYHDHFQPGASSAHFPQRRLPARSCSAISADLYDGAGAGCLRSGGYSSRLALPGRVDRILCCVVGQCNHHAPPQHGEATLSVGAALSNH